ncbi:MAG: hypothetical protein ACREJS_10710 [Candidatus Rokuibacteriota bacterium]
MESMRPEQILLLLVFILVPLLSLLVRWLQGRARRPTESRSTEPGAREGRPSIPIPRVRVIEPALPREGRRTTPPAPPPPPVLRRAGPLGGRAAVRQAIVMMTILDQCRGLEAPRPVPSPPRRR